ncbi:MAG TPA: phosphoadenylyl-sulfate reductase [Burkholderiales bacterium]|nr:phosphoadenylyl-sulfate reductase [Burkholderiales bacterium]
MSRVDEALQLLAAVAGSYGPAALSSSLGAEDMVLTDLIAREGLPIEIFTLDTGRLHAETRQLAARIQSYYGVALRVLHPEPVALAGYVARHGRDAFYESRALRERCCEIRKVEPLRRALEGKRGWVTGLRRGQSRARAALAVAGFDAALQIAKFNPLAEWSQEDVWEYLRAHRVPVNPLHERGFPSIGCEPCTRAVRPGEDERAGRWWWEEDGKKECGLHVGVQAEPQVLAFQRHLVVSGREMHPAGNNETMEMQPRDISGPGATAP